MPSARGRSRRAPVWVAAALLSVLASGCVKTNADTSAIVIEKQGAFAVGGRVVGDASASLHCDHGVVEYQIPSNARAMNLLMWHSASAVAWQQRWDGGEGFQSIFLRRGFPVYLWDGPRVGRANWGCAETTYTPGIGRDQQNFTAWRFGAEYPNWFDGVQFPKDDAEAFNQAMRARYQEFDTVPNAQLESDAAAVLADKIGPTVALTNSAGGLRALLTALKSDSIKGIVMYENVGYVFPEGEGPDLSNRGRSARWKCRSRTFASSRAFRYRWSAATTSTSRRATARRSSRPRASSRSSTNTAARPRFSCFATRGSRATHIFRSRI